MEIKIKVLGSGCAKCKKLHELTQEVVKELGFELNVEYVTDISEIIAMGVMSSPVLAINNKPILVGVLPSKEELKEMVEKSVKDNFEFKGCGCDDKSDCGEDCDCNKTAQCDCGGKCSGTGGAA